MVTPIDAVRFHASFGEADFWPCAEGRYGAVEDKQEPYEEHLAPARGAMLGLALGGLMWVGLIVAFRAMMAL